MSVGSVFGDIRKKFFDVVETGLSVPIEYPGFPMTKPTDGSAYGVLSIFSDANEHLDFGGDARTYERRGLCVLQIFAPINDGPAESETIAQAVESATRNVAEGSVTFVDPYSVPVGMTDDGTRFQMNVYSPFRAYATE